MSKNNKSNSKQVPKVPNDDETKKEYVCTTCPNQKTFKTKYHLVRVQILNSHRNSLNLLF